MRALVTTVFVVVVAASVAAQRSQPRTPWGDPIAAFLGPEHAPDNWWQPNPNLDKGSQAWWVIEERQRAR